MKNIILKNIIRKFIFKQIFISINEAEGLIVIKYDEEEVSEKHIETFLKEEGAQK